MKDGAMDCTNSRVTAVDETCPTGSVPGEEPTELERFLAHMLNTSAEMTDDFAAQVGAGLRPKPVDPDAPKERPMTAAETQLVVERTALEELWRAVRGRSTQGQLTGVSQLADLVEVPSHMGGDEFVTMAFDALEACREGRPFEGSGIPVVEDEGAEDGAEEGAEDAEGSESAAENVAMADSVVLEGVPLSFDVVASEEEAAQAEEALGDEAAEDAEGVLAPQGEGPEEEGGAGVWVEPAALEQAQAPLDCDDIAVIEGKSDTYLYGRESMTDNFAHWAYLAAENDDVATFVDNVREESRVYPRPMLAKSFKNFPYRWSMERVEEAYEAVVASGDYPDIERVAATNGDVYFYSTEYLSKAQAKALAQWYSVEKPLNV